MFPPYLTAAVSQSLQKEEGLVSPLHCWWSSLFLEVSTSNPTGNQLNIASTLLQKKLHDANTFMYVTSAIITERI